MSEQSQSFFFFYTITIYKSGLHFKLSSEYGIHLKNTQTYNSNGKLLFTGEYLVLEGAKALALPTKFGQDLVVEFIEEPKLYWESYDDKGQIWFHTIFQLPLTNLLAHEKIALTLFQILQQAQKQNPNFLSGKQGFKVKTNLDFPRDWGLGSSSTLINNIAKWSNINAFELLQKTMGGSGYDIACAQNESPILYKLTPSVADTFLKPQVTTINYKPKFSDQLYFVHLNKKQISSKEIQRFKEMQKGKEEAIKTISEITELLVKTTKLDDFEKLIKEHEKLLASVLQRPTVQELLFKDYFGQTKSLGAWGGDFILATGNDDTPKYFKKKGFETVLLYDEMILNTN